MSELICFGIVGGFLHMVEISCTIETYFMVGIYCALGRLKALPVAALAASTVATPPNVGALTVV